MFVGNWKELVRTSMAMCERTSLSIRQNQVNVAVHQGRVRGGAAHLSQLEI